MVTKRSRSLTMIDGCHWRPWLQCCKLQPSHINWCVSMEMLSEVTMEHELKGILRHRIFMCFDYERWLYKHVFMKTTLGLYLKEEIIAKQFLQYRYIECYHCKKNDIMLAPTVLVRCFYQANPNTANALYQSFKDNFESVRMGARSYLHPGPMNLL